VSAPQGLLARESVRRVQAALAAGGSAAQVIALAATARTAADAAASLGVPVGAIVKTLVFAIGGRAVLALVAGDRQCDIARLPNALGVAGAAARADADLVKQATGFSIGGVAPLGHPAPIPTAIDASLGRFETVYAAAGHPHCVFATSLAELERLTRGRANAALTN
jgi:prolyl-tRNA editing enzyme YbaK/EbsC (Cys-tRNA(Pro) deacylase)